MVQVFVSIVMIAIILTFTDCDFERMCVCVCEHVAMHAIIHTNMHTHTQTQTQTHRHTDTQTHTHTQTHTQTHRGMTGQRIEVGRLPAIGQCALTPIP